MMAAHAPVQAPPAKRSPQNGQYSEVYSEFGEESMSFGCYTACLEQALLRQAIEHQHGELAGEMVVAHPSLAQSWLAGTGAQAHGTRPVRHAHQALQQVRDIAIRQVEIAVASLCLHRQETRIDKVGEVRADGLLGDIGNLREERTFLENVA